MTALSTDRWRTQDLIRHMVISAIILILFMSAIYFLSLRDVFYLRASLNAVFRNDQSIGNTALISRRLADLESVGLLSCVRLKSETIGEFYNTSFKRGCEIQLRPFEVAVHGDLTAISGEKVAYDFILKRTAEYFATVAFSIATVMLLANSILYTYSFRRSAKNREAALRGRLIEIAEQASHDIRSPLSALKMALRDLGCIPESRRAVIEKAADRINTIANELLAKSRVTPSPIAESNLKKAISITALLQDLVEEKKQVYLDRSNLSFKLDLGATDVQASIEKSALSRVLSNLINNSVEAIVDSGQITVGLRNREAKGFVIMVNDTGVGIPQPMLDRLGREKVESTKKGVDAGYGVGLFYARQVIETLGGSMQIQSREGVGTLITLSFRYT